MKKGFTLVELLTVLLVLAAIGLITIPIVNKSINQGKEGALQETISNIEHAALTYSIEHQLDMDVNYNALTLDELKNKGYLENEDIINPVTNEIMTGCVLYKWENNQYNFKYSDDCKEAISYNAGDLLEIEVGNNEKHNFYVLKDNGSTLTLIMDRNLGDNVALLTQEDIQSYIEDNNIDTSSFTEDEIFELYNDIGPVTASNYLNSLTTNWKNIKEKRLPTLTEIFEQTIWYQGLTKTEKDNLETTYLNKIMSIVTDNEELFMCESNAECRLGFTNAGYGDLLLPTWLDINLYTSGDDYEGYWINGFMSTQLSNAFFVYYFGLVNGGDMSSNIAVRPVITINKSYVIDKLEAPVYVDEINN